MGYRSFIFDLDGTLIDTEAPILRTWQFTLKECGYDFSLEAVKTVLGVTTEIGLKRLGVSVDAQYTERWQANYAQFAGESRYFDGAKEMLQTLNAQGCVVGAVSSRSKTEYAQYFGRFDFDRLLDYVVLEEDTFRPKPNAEPILKYLEISGTRPEESIYIGDMPTDAQCARNAGIASALVKWNDSDVDVSIADYVIDSVSDVMKMIGSKKGNPT